MPSFDCGWSPDSQRIAFSTGENIFSITAGGTALVRLTKATAKEVAPVWSPDGKTIAFLRQKSRAKSAAYDLWTMAADGSRQALVAGNVSAASWSPDGTKIAFIWNARPGQNYARPQGLWVSQPDGSGQVLIARGATDFDWQRLP